MDQTKPSSSEFSDPTTLRRTSSDRPPITYTTIPSEMPGSPYIQPERPWKRTLKRSEYQDTDEGYAALRDTMILCYNRYNTPKKWLEWTWNEQNSSVEDRREGYCPLSVRTLDFECAQCNTCGVLYESMSFSGEVRYISDVSHTEVVQSYSGHLKESPFCLCSDYVNPRILEPNEVLKKLSEKSFLFMIYLDTPEPTGHIQFFNTYSRSALSPMCLHTVEELHSTLYNP